MALLPEPTIRQEVRAGTLASVPLEGCRFVRPLGIIHRRQHRLGGAALHFLELLREVGDHAGAGPSARQRQGRTSPTASRALPRRTR